MLCSPDGGGQPALASLVPSRVWKAPIDGSGARRQGWQVHAVHKQAPLRPAYLASNRARVGKRGTDLRASRTACCMSAPGPSSSAQAAKGQMQNVFFAIDTTTACRPTQQQERLPKCIKMQEVICRDKAVAKAPNTVHPVACSIIAETPWLQYFDRCIVRIS